MSNFKYTKALGLGEFRLLRLLKGERDAIQCELFDSEFAPPDRVQKYVALSYTWGSKFRPCNIVVNGIETEVTSNVYLALQDLRFKEDSRLLWIDALCINQSDEKEKSYQVQQMGLIYKNAEKVIIWLGEATFRTDYVLSFLQQLDIRQTAGDQDVLDNQQMNLWSQEVQNLEKNQRDYLVECLELLLHRDWFKRVWIIQETANARAAEIVCGTKSITTRIFARAPSLLNITLDHHSLHYQPLLEIMPSPLRNSSWWAKNRRPDLKTILDKFRSSDATDPRDKIYALLGISSDACDVDRLVPDYEKLEEDIVFDTCSFLLQFQQLDPPFTWRFFDWSLADFVNKLDFLAAEVFPVCGK
jgi:Heterokaryon incompatibility protein (HET)